MSSPGSTAPRRPAGTVVFVGGERASTLAGMSRQLRGALLSPLVRQRLVSFLDRERSAAK